MRAAIGESLRRDHGLNYGIDQITVACGAKQVVFNALFARLDAGDEVVIPTPCWVSYPDMVTLAGGKPVLVDCSERDGFKLRPEALDQAITPHTKWLMLNSPCNPTVRSTVVICSRSPRCCAGMAMCMCYPTTSMKSSPMTPTLQRWPQVAPDLCERTLTVNGMSKADAMTGWRVGYGAGPLALIKAMNLIQGQTSSHTSSVSQYAARGAVRETGPYHRVRARVYAATRSCYRQAEPGQGACLPCAGRCLFPSCAGVIGKRTPDGKMIETDSDFAVYLLDAFAVTVVPGSGFMASPYTRISDASSLQDLTRACDRIIAAGASLS